MAGMEQNTHEDSVPAYNEHAQITPSLSGSGFVIASISDPAQVEVQITDVASCKTNRFSHVPHILTYDPELGTDKVENALAISFSPGRDVHDATIVFISLRPLTASIKRPVWQAVYLMIAMFFIFSACRSLLALLNGQTKCPSAQVMVVLMMAQAGTSTLAALILARFRCPHHGIKLIGAAAVVMALLSAAAVVVDGIICKDLLRGALSYAAAIPQALAIAYAYLCNECRWHQVQFVAGCTNLLVGIPLSYVLGEIYFNMIGCGAMSLLYACLSFLWHRFLLSRALRALRPFKKQFDDVWAPIKESQRNDIMELTAVVHGHTQHKQLQPVSNLHALMRIAGGVDQWYQDVVASWAEELQLRHTPAPLKAEARILEKIERSYMGQVERVLDLVRASIIVESVGEAKQALELVLSRSIVCVVKCRYDLDYDGGATNGYRDINLQLSFRDLQGTPFEGFVFELQIVLSDFFKIKSEGQHKRYIECRNLRGN